MAIPLHTREQVASAPWLDEPDFGLDDFRAQVERDTDIADYPHADEVRGNVLVYSAPAMDRVGDLRALQAELIRALADGPGVVVFTDAFHASVVDRASEAFRSTAAERARIAEIIARSRVFVQVGYQRRFDAAFAAVKQAVDSGSLGALITVRSTTMDPAPPPMDYIKGSGGIFRDCAVPDVDAIRWITGQNVVDVYATGSVQGDPLFTECGDVDTAAIVVRFDGGAFGVVSAARYNGRGYDCRLEVHGFDDTVVAGWDQGAPVHNADPANDFPSGQPHHFFMDRFTAAFRTELSEFVNVVAGEPNGGATVADAVEVAWIAEAATESLRRGVPVSIESIKKEAQQ